MGEKGKKLKLQRQGKAAKLEWEVVARLTKKEDEVRGSNSLFMQRQR
jgi:hypothetical protein